MTRVKILHDLPVSPNLPAHDRSNVCDLPSLSLLTDGRVMIVYRRGATKHSHDGVFVIQSTSDGGQSWSEPRVAFDGREMDPNLAATTGGICQASDGTLVFPFFVVEGLKLGVGMFDEVGFKLPRKIFISLSHDAGDTWSIPEPYAYPDMPLSAITEKPFVLPDGEIFTGPVEDSLNGWVRYTYPAIMQGRVVEGIELKFENGKVIKASADKNEDFLLKMIGSDEGASYVGEFAIGTNYGIQQFTGSILFDEKIGGSFHMALGAGYPETGSLNKSQIHWDMICDMRNDSEILMDNELVYKDGQFVI